VEVALAAEAGLPTLEEQIAEGRRFFVELEVPGGERCPVDFGGSPDPVLFFASWAFAVRFGGMHELAQAAMHIERRHKVKLRPLLRYADRNVDDEADRRELERVWQPASDLAECTRALVMALRSGDAKLDELMAGHETVADRLDELAQMCEWAAAREARVRLSFDMSHDEPTAPRPDASAHGSFLGPLGDAQRAERDAPR
jgi:hypothetical protein